MTTARTAQTVRPYAASTLERANAVARYAADVDRARAWVEELRGRRVPTLEAEAEELLAEAEARLYRARRGYL